MVIISNITKKHDNICLTHSLKNVHFPRQVEISTKYNVNISITGIMFDDMWVTLMDISHISGILQLSRYCLQCLVVTTVWHTYRLHMKGTASTYEG